MKQYGRRLQTSWVFTMIKLPIYYITPFSDLVALDLGMPWWHTRALGGTHGRLVCLGSSFPAVRRNVLASTVPNALYTHKKWLTTLQMPETCVIVSTVIDFYSRCTGVLTAGMDWPQVIKRRAPGVEISRQRDWIWSLSWQDIEPDLKLPVWGDLESWITFINEFQILDS